VWILTTGRSVEQLSLGLIKGASLVLAEPFCFPLLDGCEWMDGCETTWSCSESGPAPAAGGGVLRWLALLGQISRYSTGSSDRLVLAEDPPAFGEVYILSFFQFFIYFICSKADPAVR
jgi:hypothetical protein